MIEGSVVSVVVDERATVMVPVGGDAVAVVVGGDAVGNRAQKPKFNGVPEVMEEIVGDDGIE